MAYITIADVRHAMKDRMAEDHLVLPDLAFSDEDIEWAMKQAARKYNSIPPLISTATWNKLPESTMLFFDGIAWSLYQRMQENAALNDVDYSAGGVSANVQGNLVQNLSQLAAARLKAFVEEATTLKVTANILDGFGNVG